MEIEEAVRALEEMSVRNISLYSEEVQQQVQLLRERGVEVHYAMIRTM